MKLIFPRHKTERPGDELTCCIMASTLSMMKSSVSRVESFWACISQIYLFLHVYFDVITFFSCYLYF